MLTVLTLVNYIASFDVNLNIPVTLLQNSYVMSRDVDRRVLNYRHEAILFESDVQLLADHNWLNDQIVTFALLYLYYETLDSTQQQSVSNNR